MLSTNCFQWWREGGVAFLLLVSVPVLASGPPLFPVPLHLVRHVEDPIANATVDVDEYCIGNRIITISGSRTAIVDYDRQELLEIDRAHSTYSVARFDEIARSRPAIGPTPSKHPKETAAVAETWKTTALGVTQSRAGRSADSFEVTANNITIEVAVDRQLTMSRAAFDALTGAGYPNNSSDQQEAIARACVRQADVSATTTGAPASSYGLPLDQSITFAAGPSAKVTIHNTIVRITNDLPPPELLAIPAGAKLVDSRAAKMQKALKELGDAPPSKP